MIVLFEYQVLNGNLYQQTNSSYRGCYDQVKIQCFSRSQFVQMVRFRDQKQEVCK